MIIEIKNSAGYGMRTESLSCLYPLETLKNIQAAGYSFYVDSKKMSAAVVDGIRNDALKEKKAKSNRKEYHQQELIDI